METKELGNGFYCDSVEEKNKEIDVLFFVKVILPRLYTIYSANVEG